MPDLILKTLKVRVKDKHAKLLSEYAFAVNQVWNEINTLTYDAWHVPVPEVGYIKGVWLSAYEVHPLIKNYRYERDLTIASATVQAITEEHAKARKKSKKSKLKWRSSGGSRKSLGWVPFKIGQLRYKAGHCVFGKSLINVWDSYNLSKYEFRSGNFSEDSRGRWYLNINVEIPVEKSTGTGQIGIDLGLKTTATCSDGTTLQRQNFYRDSESKLGKAQRAHKKKQVKSVHTKIKNRRKDYLHKFTTKLVQENELIVVGNVSSSGLAKTKMAKSVLDAGWYMLKTYLDYKSKGMQVMFVEVNESYTTQTCSHCQKISDNSPKGRAGLGIREWICTECGTLHDRDVNAAINILRLGHQTLAEGI